MSGGLTTASRFYEIGKSIQIQDNRGLADFDPRTVPTIISKMSELYFYS